MTYDHQPEFTTVTVAACPGNDQAGEEPVILSAGCVCGLPRAWEAPVQTSWRETAGHATAGGNEPGSTMPVVPQHPAPPAPVSIPVVLSAAYDLGQVDTRAGTLTIAVVDLRALLTSALNGHTG